MSFTKKSPLDVGFATKTDLNNQTVEVFLFNSIHNDGGIASTRVISIEDFVDTMNCLPKEIAERIVGGNGKMSKRNPERADQVDDLSMTYH